MRVALIGMAALAALASTAGALEFTSTDDPAAKVVADAFASSILDSRSAGAQENIITSRADLDNDGLPEIIGMLQSGYLCGGGGGCPIGIFKANADGSFAYVTSVQGDFFDILETSTKGWRDISVASQTGAVTLVWTGSDYLKP